jgi:hypothetical protein
MSETLKLNRLDTVPQVFLKQVEKLLPEIYAKLLTELAFDLDSFGNIITSEANMLRVLAIVDSYSEFLLDPKNSEYIKSVRSFMGEFETQKLINDKLLARFGTLPEASQVVYGAARRQTLELLVGDGFKTNFVDRIRSTMIDSVSTQSSFTELTKSLTNVVLGDGQKDSQLLNWSKQVAHDRFAIADRSYTYSAAEAFGIEWFKYAGGLIEDSREFCVERNGKFYHKSEVQAWASLDWAGKMPNTDADTIFIKCGGWRCNHSLIAVSEFDVPEEKRKLFQS